MANSQDADSDHLSIIDLAFAPDEVAYLDMQGKFALSFERKLKDKIKELKDESIKVKENSNKLTASNAKTKKLIDDIMVRTETVLNLMPPETEKSSNFAKKVAAAKAATTTLEKQLTNLSKSMTDSKKVMTEVSTNIKLLHADFSVLLEQAKKATSDSELDQLITQLNDLESQINSKKTTETIIKATNSLRDSAIQYAIQREKYMIGVMITPHYDEVTSDEDDKHVSPNSTASEAVITIAIGLFISIVTKLGEEIYKGYNDYNDLLRKRADLLKKIADKKAVVAIAKVATDKSEQIFTSIDQHFTHLEKVIDYSCVQ
ncbi:hypothetical protein XNA1_3140007 [Xenorhabdus nematophila str. Anatoliense]|nr:hypothetical protein XNA1_3140007 [Xenorhabdus nematophila str. Anatoliense]